MVSTISRYSRCLAAVVEVSEPSQRCVGPVEVFGLVDLVEFLESIPSRSQPRMSVEQPIQMRPVGVCEVVGPAQQSEPGSEQVRFVCWGPLIGGAALYLPTHQSEAFGEPADDVEAVEHVAGVG